MFKPDTFIIMSTKNGIEKTIFGGQRGRELLQREAPQNNSKLARAFYVALSLNIISLYWVRGNLGDVFIDSPELPKEYRINPGMRETTIIL